MKIGLNCPFCPVGGDAGSCSCISQGKRAYIVVCLAQRFGLACPHSLRDATGCCASHYVDSIVHFTRTTQMTSAWLSFVLWSSLKIVGVHHFFDALVQLPCNILFPYQKSKKHAPKGSCFLLFGGDAGS